MSKTVQLRIDGITCAHCAQGLEEHLRDLGLSDARVEFSSKRAVFTANSVLSTADVIGSLKKIGFQAFSSEQVPTVSSLRSVEFITPFCILLALPLILGHFFHFEWLHNPLLQLAFTTPIMLSGGTYFAASAARSLRLGRPNMDVLIALGTWAAFVYSLAGTFLNLGPQYQFYETSASIVAIVLFGNFLEARAVRRTEASLLKLQQGRSETVRVKQQGNVISVALNQLKVGDLMLLSPGDRVPADGTILSGKAELDESFLTGESLPRSVAASEKIASGSLLIGGTLEVSATAVGEESSLSKIIRTIQEARSAKPELERLADRLTHYFVPVVLVFALLAYVGNLFAGETPTESLLRAIAVLVVSCPCALGLATPTAVTVSLGLASRLGILVRKASVFEALTKIQALLVDKTGTLTDGNFKVDAFETAEADSSRCKQIILGLEQLSHHPIALALRNFCEQVDQSGSVRISQIDEQRSLGVTGKGSEGQSYELSSREVPPPFNVALRENGNIIARIKLTDSLRKESLQFVNYFQRQGIPSVIVSGDSKERVDEAASRLEIKETHSRLTPDQKLALVTQKESQFPIAFVGDGINDAAALARASVGVTFGAATDLARHSADVTITSGGLEKLAYLQQLSKRTVASIKQNLFWAFAYNIICLPIAALGFLSPLHAAFAMVASDLIVVANSLRLKFWKPKAI